MFMFQHLVKSVPRRVEAVRELHMVLRLSVQQASIGVVFGFIALPSFECSLNQGSKQDEELPFEFKCKEVEFK